MNAGDAVPPRQTRAVPGAVPNRIKEELDDAKASLKEMAEKVKGKVRTGHGVPRSPEERLKAGVPYSKWSKPCVTI
jgi:hypothetical protein